MGEDFGAALLPFEASWACVAVLQSLAHVSRATLSTMEAIQEFVAAWIDAAERRVGTMQVAGPADLMVAQSMEPLWCLCWPPCVHFFVFGCLC